MEPIISNAAADFAPVESCAVPEWFAIYVMSRHEKRIAGTYPGPADRTLSSPYGARHTWKDGSKVTVQLPLFPNYLFVRALRGQRGRSSGSSGVLSAVGKRESSVISRTYIATLRKAVTLGKVEPHPYLATGAFVHIRSGALAGLQGIVVRQKSSCRVVLSLELIRRSVAVEVDIADL